ncbi:phage tail protein [uncultured Bilophila sp.]|uniref:phage tail protein n=1 Tax=uncultured Bilophila sp. TaxID=529385 RepID=UPI0035A65800
MPVGTVIVWPSASWPTDADNWLECNGQAISSAVYLELVVLVGATVPDYRGIFLRGHGLSIMEQWCIPVSVWENSRGWYSGYFGPFHTGVIWNIT